MVQLLIHIMGKKARNKAQNIFIKKIVENIAFFQRNKHLLQNRTLVNLLFQKIQLCHYKERQIIFRQGDPGYIYYIVIQGAVDLLIRHITQGDKTGKKHWSKLQSAIISNKAHLAERQSLQ